MAILIPALNRAKEHGKRAACLNNLKQLTLSWQMYAQANDDKLVNGAPMNPGAPCPANTDCPTGSPCDWAAQPPVGTGPFPTSHKNEVPWVGIGWEPGSPTDAPAPKYAQKCAIQTGAMWKFVQTESIYKCPTGEKDSIITYPIVDSMNGKYNWNLGPPGAGDCPSSLLLKNLGQIRNPANRLVFIDEGKLSPDSYAVYYNAAYWFDPPMSRHGNGTNMSYADGHTGRIMWKAKETVDFGNENPPHYNARPLTCAGRQDVYKIQVATWGNVGPNYDKLANCKLESD
jgi:prepilin-type processing-associated H-X9-DG protein